MQNNIKAVILDFDGTIAKLKTDYTRLRNRLNEYFKEFGIDKEFKPIFRTIEECAEQLKERPDVNEIEKKAHKIINEEELKESESAELKKDAKEVLKELKDKYKLIIFTNNCFEVVEKAFNRFGLPFPNMIISRVPFEKAKPNVARINNILEKMNINSEECILIGDSELDAECGKNANIKTILVDENKSLKNAVEEINL